MTARAWVVVLVAFVAGCDSSTSTDACGTAASTTPTPIVSGGAAGLCDAWQLTPLDLGAFPTQEEVASFAAIADGRGGVTLTALGTDGGAFAVSYAISGATSGAPLTLAAPSPDGSLVFTEVVASPKGWVAALSNVQQPAALRVYDALGSTFTSLPVAGERALFSVGVDGTIGLFDGVNIGWFLPGASSETVRAATGQGSVIAWSGDTAYAASATGCPTVHSFTSDGPSVAFPSFEAPYGPIVAGAGGHAIAGLTGVSRDSSDVEGPLGVAFASATDAPRWFVLNEEVSHAAGAWRPVSQGVVIAWTSSGQTLAGGAPMGLVEIAPSGVRGPLVPLGSEIVVAANVAIGGTGDGSLYVALAWTTSVRLGWIVRCVA